MKIAEDYLLGIDLGTTNVKGIVLDGSGSVVASASRTNKLLLPGPTQAEQDANDWWTSTVSLLQEMTQQLGSNVVSRIRGICVSSQTVTMLPLDQSGAPLRNALIWMDMRSSEELQEIIDKIGFNRFVTIVGGRPDVAFLPNKLLWFKKNEPGLFKKTYRVLQASSFLNWKLTGEMTMDIDQASRCQCLDISTLKWSEEIADAIGIDLNNILPQPVPVDQIIGTVTAKAATETGLAAGTPVVAGASDAMASMYATGLSKLGEIGESSGTTSLVFIGSDHASAPDVPVVTKPCAIAGMPYVFDAPINTSGASIKWYLDTLGQEECAYASAHGKDAYTYFKELAAEAPAGANGLLFFPYLMGERAPLWNSYARGMFIGISIDTSRKDFIRSVLEGTSFALRHVVSTIQASGVTTNCLRITGGGAKNHIWSKIKASMLNLPVYLLDERSGDVPFGDTLIVGHSVGVFPDLTESVSRMVHIKEIIEPVPEWTKVYDRMYPLYVEMYKHLDHDLKHMKTILV